MRAKLEVVSLVIAILAFVVSGLTWRDGRLQRELIAEQLRPYVQVVHAELVKPLGASSFVQLKITAKNFGQIAAETVRADMDYRVDLPEGDGGGESATRMEIGPMGPAVERTFILQSNRMDRRTWAVRSQRMYETAYFYGSLW
ncbi:MAG: hypothetical protein AAF481_07870 [Acidobacteriota bacterium]